jgi:Tfp pilus assembly protein PilF
MSQSNPAIAPTIAVIDGTRSRAAGTPSSIKTESLSHVLGAHNACNLASCYLERGNLAAARRKLVQALASVNQVSGQGGAA